MTTFKEFTKDYSLIISHQIVFNSQFDVRYDSPLVEFKCRLSKSDLIAIIRYFTAVLLGLGYSDKLKTGFNLESFKYYELSVYLHGIMQVYNGVVCIPPVGNLSIEKFSRLPHDVMKPEKELKIVRYAILDDIFGGQYYCCVISGIALCSCSLVGLENQILTLFPNLISQCNLRFELVLPF